MNQIIYIASPENKKIYVWKLNDTGLLLLLQIINTPGSIQPMVLHPNKKYLYVGVRPIFGIIIYRIKRNGTLFYISTISLINSSSYLSIDLLGKYLFSASYSGNCVNIYQIKFNGMIIKLTQQINNLITPHSVNINPLNMDLLIPCLTEDCIYIFKFNMYDKWVCDIKNSINTISGSGPRHMVFYPDGKYAYCINELNCTINILMISNNGKKYNLINTLKIMPNNFLDICWASDIHITPNSCFLYTSERTSSILTCFSISLNGKMLSIIDYVVTETQPRSFSIDNSGKFLISLGQKSNYISIYKINQKNGTLNIFSRYLMEKGLIWISILQQ